MSSFLDNCTESVNQSLKVTWIKKYLDLSNNGKWKKIFCSTFRKLGIRNAFKCNLDKKDIRGMNIQYIFLRELLEIWSDISFKNSPSSFNDFLNMDLWNNSLIRVGNKPVNCKSWIHKGINKVKQITENNLFLGYTDFLALYNIKTSFIEYYGITTALSKNKKNMNQQQPIDDQDIKSEWYEKIATCNKVSRTSYKTLVATVQTKPDKSEAKWTTDCNLREIDSSTWQKIYIKPFSCTKSSKLRNFKFKFNHRRIATNAFLKHISITEDDFCSFCKSDK